MKPHEHPEEAALILKAQQGDMEAFETLVRKYQQMIYALCRRLTGAHQSADDLAQETFIKAYFALSRFDTRWPLYPWLRRIAVNTTFNYLKARKREKPLPAESREGRKDFHSPATNDPQISLERTEFEEHFHQALKSLPEEQRDVFILRFYENMSYDEISQALNLPAGTVMSRLNRARRKLKALLADSFEGRT